MDDNFASFLIYAAIIELFHLLPMAASKFLDELVTLTIELEGALPPGQVYSEINSPYRPPLTKFLNRYATAAVDYFLARLNEPKYFRRCKFQFSFNILTISCSCSYFFPLYAHFFFLC